MESCLADVRCQAFTFDRENRFNGNCWLKSAPKSFKDYSGLTSGVRCDVENTPQLTQSGNYPDTGSYFMHLFNNQSFSARLNPSVPDSLICVAYHLR